MSLRAMALSLGLGLGLCNGASTPATPVAFTSYDWTANTDDTSFTARDGAMPIYFAGKWWLLGGWNPGAFGGGTVDTTNQILESDDATTWTEALAHAASPPTSGAGARWKRRHWFGRLTHTYNGTEYVYVLGGDHESPSDGDFSGSPSNGYQTDIWRTTDPGGDWERVAASGDVPFAGRMLTVYGSSPGALWAFGGQNGLLGELAGAVEYHNDLYRSTDGGATWTEVLADASASATRPSARGMIDKMPYWNGRMWLVSGGTYDTAASATRDYFREVWSFDPSDPASGFTQHETPPWLGGQYNNVDIFDDRLWYFSGYSHGINTRTVWSTADGDRWVRHETPAWPPSHADGVAVNGSTLLHIAGNGDIGGSGTMHAHTLVATDYAEDVVVPTPLGVWDMANAVTSGSNITSVPDDGGSTGVALVPNVSGDAVYSASNAAFGSKPSATGDGGHFLHTASAVDLSTCEIFIVAKPATTDGLFYFAYALLTGPVRYVYFASNRTGADDNETTLSMDVLRGGVNTTGSAVGALDVEDVMHIYTLRYTGAAATSGIDLDGARTLPDTGTLTGDAGTGAFSAVLYFFSDNSGTGSKGADVAEIRLYPALTASERAAVVRELRAKFPYAYPP